MQRSELTDLLMVPFLTVLLVLGGCGEQATESPEQNLSWERITPENLSDEMESRLDRAENARKELGKTLFGRLSEVMSTEGPAAAVDVCNVEAQGMTRDIAKRFNVNIGRTSFKLRNPENVPPEWAREFDLIEKRVENQVLLKKGNERLAVLTPIHLAGKCGTCHGPKDQIPDSVQAELQKRYPEDEATGFNVGDLRGWFWVEVPASEET